MSSINFDYSEKMLLSDTGDNETEIDATTDLVVGAYTL
jgi:hypothetical protein